jgi:hypothetical protein
MIPQPISPWGKMLIDSVFYPSFAYPTDEWWEVYSFPFLLYLPSRAKLWCTLQLKGQILSSYFSSTLFSSVASPSPVGVCWALLNYNSKEILYYLSLL